ncbi:hypothetical protein [Viridibacillus arvi]|uniref:hypothetical protein n=1 Tax=Viridibacillus arvi TaxID=263475 RepID=UPI003CFDA398
MKPYLVLENGSHDLTTVNYFEGEINSVGYFAKGNYILINAKDFDGELAESIVWKDNAITKKLETLLEDELETLNDWSHAGMQENNVELILKAQVKYNMQSSKIDGIEAALELVQGGE